MKKFLLATLALVGGLVGAAYSASTSPVYYSPPTISTTLGRATEWIAGQIEVHTSSKNHEQVAVIGSTGTYLKYGVTVGTLTVSGLTQGASAYWSSWVRFQSSGSYEGLLRAASFYSYGTIFSTSGAILGGSTITAVISSTYCWNGFCYGMPMADGTNGQVLTTNGSMGLSWGAGPGLSNPLGANLNISSFSIHRVGQLQFVATMTVLDIMNQVSIASGALLMALDQSVWVATSAGVSASWMYLSSPREVDNTTGALCKWKMSYNDVGGKTTFDLVVPTRTGSHLVAGDFDLNAGTVGFVNRGINGTAAFQAGPSTGVLSIPGEGYASPHAGNSTTGRITIMFYVMYFGQPGANRYLVSRRSPSAYEYGIYLDVTAPPKLHADLLVNGGGGVMTAETNAGSTSTGTWNCIAVSFDKAANVTNMWVNKVAQTLINVSNSPATTAFNGASLRIGMDADNGGPANAIIDNVYIFGDHASQTNVNAFCDMKRYP